LLVPINIFIGVFGTMTLFMMGDLLLRQLRQEPSWIMPRCWRLYDHKTTTPPLKGSRSIPSRGINPAK
jgi:hypothetical protein